MNTSKFSSLCFLVAAALQLQACGKDSASSSADEDNSASGAVASAIGGALSGTSGNGTQAFFHSGAKPSFTSRLAKATFDFVPDALAATSCPTFLTASGNGCTASASSLWLTYASCSFGGSASWSGTQALIMSGGSAACGTFPNPGASGTLTRQFVTASGGYTPGSATVTTARGISVHLDHATANLGNFDGASIATIANGGYGVQVAFNGSGARSSITLDQRVYVSAIYDHSVSGQATVTESAGASSRTISGSLKVYHNLMRVIGTSTLTNVTHSDNCCYPTGGTITTAFSAGSNVQPSLLGSKVVGKSETLTFTGCGTATLAGADGSSADVTLAHCL
jgi:hypothetical protein